MARQKSTFSVPLQTDILSGGNVGLSFGNGPLPVGDLSISIFFLTGTVHAVCIFFTPFWKAKNLFLRSFFHKILTLCMVSIQERFMIKSGRAYGIYLGIKVSRILLVEFGWYHNMARVNLNTSKKVLTTTASKYIPKSPRICIN